MFGLFKSKKNITQEGQLLKRESKQKLKEPINHNEVVELEIKTKYNKLNKTKENQKIPILFNLTT